MKDAAFYNAVYDLLVDAGAREALRTTFVREAKAGNMYRWNFMANDNMIVDYSPSENKAFGYREPRPIVTHLNSALARIEKGTE